MDTASGTPRLVLTIGSNTRSADYSASGSTATAVVFAYPVTVDDHDQDGISIAANALELNGGAIHKPGHTNTNAVLDHAVSTQSGHRVNRDPVIVSGGVAVTSTPRAATETYGADEIIEISVTFSDAVNATTDTDFVLSVGGADKRAPLRRGSGTKTLVFGYTVQAGDSDTDGIWIGDQNRTLVGNRNGNPQNGAITSVTTSRAAALTHGALGMLSGHKVDGSLVVLPSIVSGGVAITSSPGTRGYYLARNYIQVTVTFSEAVAVDITNGTPRLALSVGSNTRYAGYSATDSAATALAFAYRVVSGDNDQDGISIAANALELNGGVIHKPGDTSAYALLDHAALSAQSDHRVNYVPFIVSDGVAITSTPAATTDTYGVGEIIEISVTFSDAVYTTRTDTDFVLSVGGANKRAPLRRGSGTKTLVFGYNVQAGDSETDGIWIGDQDRTLVGDRGDQPQNGRIASSDTADTAILTHGEVGTASGHKVNGSLLGPQSAVSIAADQPAFTAQLDDVTFTLTRTGSTVAARDVAVALTQNRDLLDSGNLAQTVAFRGGEATATLKLLPFLFGGHEVAEETTLTATVQPGSGYSLGSPTTASTRIGVSDPAVTVRWEETAYTFAEDATGTDAAVAVILRTATGVPSPNRNIDFSISTKIISGQAENGVDYEALTLMLTVEPSDFTPDGTEFTARKEVTLAIVDDAIGELDETLSVVLEHSPGASPVVALIQPDGTACELFRCDATVTITDNDELIEVTIAADQPAFTAELDDVTFTLTRTEDPATALTVGVALTQDQDLLSSESLTQTVTFGAGEAAATLQLTHYLFFGHTVNEETTLTATVQAGSGYVPGSPNTASTRIGVTDPAVTAWIEATAYTFAEGADATVAVILRTAADVPSPNRVFDFGLVVSLSGQAGQDDVADRSVFVVVEPSDFTPDGTEFTARKEVPLPIVDDALDEPDETLILILERGPATPLVVAFSEPDGTACPVNCDATVTITDNDDPPTLGFEDDAAATEGDDVTFAVALSAASGREVTVDWATSVETGDTATSGTDFTAVPATKLTLMPGETTATFTVQTTADTNGEADETFTVTLSSPSNATLGDAMATATIVNDDPATLSVADASATEASPVTFTVTLLPASTQTVTVNWAASVETGDTATSGTDFTAASDTLTFMPGDTTATFTVQTTDDTVDEDDETFTVTLSKPSSAPLATDPTATGTIGDDDALSCAPNPDDIWCGVVTVMEHSIVGESYDGFLESEAGDLSEKNFTYGGNPYTIDAILVGKPTGNGEGSLLFSLTSKLTQSDKKALVLYVGSTAIPFVVSVYRDGGGGHWYFWEGDATQEGLITPGPGLDWRSETTVTVRLREASTTCTPQGAIWCGVVTPGDLAGEYGFLNKIGLLSDKEFEYEGTLYEIDEVSVSDSGQLRFSLTDADLTGAHRAALALHVDGSSGSFAFSDATDPAGSHTYEWLSTGLDWSSVPPVTLRLRQRDTAPTLPGKPTNLTATGNGSTRIDLGWDAPDPGTAAITGYKIEVWADAVTGWTDLVVCLCVADTTYAHTGLSAGDTRHYRVSAINTNGTSVPSDERSATTLTNAPVFADATATRMVAENSAADTDVGDAFREATDADGDPLTYSMEGTDAASFTFDASTRQIKTKTGVTYNFEAKNTYSVTVKADDGTGGTDIIAVTITLTNVDEGRSGTVSIDDTAPMVGDELTASTAGVADPDGLPDPFAPTWQWYRTPAGGSETEIAGESSATYTVVEADLDAALTAKASWTDAGAFANTLASTPTAAVTPATCTPNPGDLWCGVVTVQPLTLLTNGHGYTTQQGSPAGGLTEPRMFTPESDPYTVISAMTGVHDGAQRLFFNLDTALTPPVRASLELHVRGDQFAFSTAQTTPQGGVYYWSTSQDWSSETSVTLRLRGLASMDATLSGLAVSDGSSDLLTFAPDTTTYTAMVANDVETVTFTATKGDDGASVAYLDSDGNPIADADTAAGHQVALAEGANVIKVRVTAEDGTAGQTYTVTVTRAVLPRVTVAAAAGGETVTEGTDAAFTLSRTGATTAALTVTVAVSQTGAVLKDASVSPSSVTFDAGSDEATLELATNDDDTDNDDGTVTVTLGTGTGYAVGDPGAATVAVSDNDVPVDFMLSVPATVAEDGGTATVTVTATTAENAPPATAVAVFLQRSSGTATIDDDYEAVSESVFIGPSEFTAVTVNGQPRYRAVWTYEVTIVDDDVVESDETLVLQMSRQATLPAIHTLGGGVGPVQATVTIVDDDAAVVPEVTIAADQAAFTAALDDVTFTLTRTEDPAAALDVAVALTQDGTLLASADLAQTVTFGAGEATATLEIASHRFASHTVTEEEATLTATVQDGTGYEPGSPNTASTRIVVADPAVTASFEQAAYTFDEAGGDATVAVILRTATGVPSPNRQIFFSISTKAISGEAVMGDDYVHQSGVFLSVLPSDFTPDGADFTARKEVTLVIVDDAIHEPDETLNMLLEPGPSTSELVAFRQPDGTACPGSGCEATVTIVDNDDSTDATLSGLAVNDGSMDLLTFVPGTTTYTATVANDVETVTFTETKNDAGASVAYLDSDDNPIADADTAAGHQVPLDVGANVITVRVTAEDGSATLDYTVTVTRGEPPPTVTVVAAAGGETVTEGTDAAFTLSRTGATAAALTVTVAVSQTGSVLKDASAVPSSVTFDAGAATATLELATNDDNTDNDDGTVTVTLGTGTGYTVGDPGAATVAVSDNDVPVDFVLSVPATVAEDAGPATVTVTATTAENAPPATAVAVQLAGVGGTATGGSDYDAVSATAVFQVSDFAAVTVGGQPRYQAVWTYDVMILDDEVVEGDETVVLEMSPTPGFLPIHTLGGVGLDAVRATVTIVDDDVPVVTIAADKSTVIEDSGAAGFTLSRTGPTEASLTVTVAVTQEVDRDLLPDGAAAERTVTFAVGSATAALSVTLKNDDLHDVTGDLTVEVRAGMGYTVGDPASATLSVIDVDTGLPKPANLMASAGAAAGEVALSWDAYAPYLVFVRHQYRYKTDGDYPETWIDIPNSGQHATGAGDGSNQTGYTVTGLVGGQLHTFQVRTYTSSSSASDPSDEAMATPRSAVVSFGAGSYSVDEGGTVEVTVQLDAAPGREVVVPVSATGEGGATAPGETGADWSGVPQNVTFGATDTARTFTLAATQDTVDDDGESVALSFGTLPDGVTAGSPSEATVTITDDDAAAGACTLNTDDIWCGVVTVGTGSDGVGFVGTTDPLTGALTDNSGDQTITIGSDGYAVSSLLVLTNQPVGALAISLDKFFPDSDEATLEFYTRSNTFKVIEATQFARGSGYYWENSGLSWSAGDEVTLRLRQAGATNNAPAFTSSETFNPAENQTTVGTVEASDDDMDDEITGYVLSGGADQTLFSIGSTSGVLTFQAAPDYEDPQDADTDNAYEVTVQATGGTEGRVLTATQTITVTVMNVAEQPDTPAKPTVTAVSGATDSLAVTWSEPDLNGGPAITGYGVEYRVGATGTWTDWSHSGTDTTTTITGLTANTDYQVQVRALNGETPSAWSDPSDAVRTTAEMTPVVTIAPDKSTVSEEAGAAGFTLSRTEPTAAALTVTVAVTQEVDRDLLPDGAAAERTVTFAAGSTTATLTVTLDDDDLAETSGALTVQVQEGDGYTVGTPSSAAVTITDGDTGTLPPAGLAASAGPRAGEVVLAWDAVAPWLEFRGHQYRYKTDGGYESWTDIPDSGPRQPNGIGWSVRGLAAGQVHTFQVRAYETPAVGDPVYGGASDEALATPLAGQVTLHLSGVNNNSALENAGPVTVTATVAPASATAFTVTVTASPVAPAMDADFELSTNQELSFAADATDSTGTVTIGLVDDDVAEPNDVVTVSGAVSDAAITAPADVTLTIANDDHDVGYDIAVVAPATVDEDAGTASVTVTLTTTQNSAPTTAPFLLYWPKPETATPDADYTRPPEVGGVVTTVAVAAFSQNAAGTAYEAQATFMIGIVDDSLDEADETIVFEVRTASDESPAHTITITDNDDPPVVSFGARSYSVDEGGTVEVTVQLESAPGREVVVPVSAAGAGGATPPGETGADWSGVPESVTFGATDTAQTFTLAATDDTDVDPGESVALSFGTLPAGVTAGTPSEASVTIVDNDMLPELSVEDAEATEASPVTFTVALSPAAAENVTVDWAASVETGDTATSGTDFTASSDTLTFMPGDTTATFTVQTTDDTVDEDDETFTVTLSSPSSSATLATDPTATGTIKDDDAVPALVIGHGSAREDSAVAFTVSLTPASGRTVTVIWAVNLSGGQTAELADFPGNSLQNGSVTFMPGQTTAQIQVSVVDDELDEGDETFEVNLAQARNARLEDNTATGTIVDNDDAANAAPTAADADGDDGRGHGARVRGE